MQIVKTVWREFKKNRRSPAWRKVRAEHIERHNECAACGSKWLLQVHHIVPFHEDPALELDPDNLITLCAATCHLAIGHGGDFKFFNRAVVWMAKQARKGLVTAKAASEAAFACREKNDGI